MAISMNSLCMECHFRRNLETARSLGNEEKATVFAKELLKLYLSLPEDRSSPELGPATQDLFCQLYGAPRDRLRKEKEEANRFVMARLEEIRNRVENAPDPLYAAVQFSVLGNYLDFAALQGQVSYQVLDKMLSDALQMDLLGGGYDTFRADLAKGKRLLYLTDNAGEIGFDRVLAERIRQEYPQLQITFCVRGLPIHNDATAEDAAVVGIDFPVIGSGSNIGGTVIEKLSPEARQALEEADIVIAKGMGNTETLYPCGYNVYYAFLAKCQQLVDFFKVPKMSAMFLRDPDYHN